MDNIDLTENHPTFQNYGVTIINSSVGQAVHRYSLSNLSALAIERNRQNSIIQCNIALVPAEIQCFPLESPCLFNLTDDPCERRNIAALRPVILNMMANEINKLRVKSQPVRNRPSDLRSNPANFNNTWTWWFDELGIPDYEENATSGINIKTLSTVMLIVVLSNILIFYI